MAGVKLIDGHAMLLRVKALQRKGAVDLSYYNTVKEAVQMEPGANAIPVEWLKQIQAGCVCDTVQAPMYVAIGWLIDMWQKERERG